MRAIPIASVIVCVVAMMSAALFCSPRPAPPDPVRTADYLDADPASRHVLIRSYAKDVVAREVIAARMALPDAAARFGWLNARSHRQPPRPFRPIGWPCWSGCRLASSTPRARRWPCKWWPGCVVRP